MSWSSHHMISWRPHAQNRHLQSHLPAGLLRPADAGRARLQGHRQTHAQRADARRPRRALPRDGHVRGLSAGAVAADAADRGLRAAGAGAVDLARAANDGMAELVARHPAAVPRLRRVARRSTIPTPSCAEARARRRRSRRARHPDVHQRPRHADLRAGVSCRSSRRWRRAICRSGCTRTAAPTVPTSRRRSARSTKSGGRSAGRTRPARRWRAWCSPGYFDRFPALKIITHHMGAMAPYFAGRVGPGLGSARRAHVGRGSLGGAEAR